MEYKKSIPVTNGPFVKAVKLQLDDLSLAPRRFETNGKSASLATAYIWGTFQDDPDKPPVHYLRSFNGKELRSGGVIRLGETPVSPHTVIHGKDLYPIGGPLPYARIEGAPEEPAAYGQSAESPRLLHSFSATHARIIESDILDWTYDYLPYALMMTGDGIFGVPHLFQCARVNGTFEGKKVSFLGGWDRVFASTFMQNSYGALLHSVVFTGEKPDGRHEWGLVIVFGDKSVGFYCKDGEEPVVSSEVKTVSAVWEPLTYLGDGTVALTKATYRFAGKEIHYQAKWGYRGWDEESIYSLKKNGYSLTSGAWYEGAAPYEHKKSFTFGENHEAFAGKV